MANGRRPRRVGFQQNTALDTLERVLGLGQNIAQTVQANRQKRDAYHIDYINALSKNINTNYFNSGAGGAEEILNKLNTYKENRMSTSSPEMLEMIDLAKMQVQNQITENSDYAAKKELMQQKQFASQKILSDLYNYQNPNMSQEEKNKLLDGMTEEAYLSGMQEKLKDSMYGFSEDFQSFYTRHADRLTSAEVDNLNVSRQYLKGALDAFKDDGKIDETEYNFYVDGIMQGNAEELKNFRSERNLNKQNSVKVLYDTFNADKKDYDIVNNAIKERKMSYSDALKFLPEGQVQSPAQSLILQGSEPSSSQLGTTPIQLNANQLMYLKNSTLNAYKERLMDTDNKLIGFGQKSSIAGLFDAPKTDGDIKETNKETNVEGNVEAKADSSEISLDGQNKSYINNKETILKSVDPEKAKRYLLDKRLDKAEKQDEFVKNYKIGDSFDNFVDSGTKSNPAGDGALNDEELKNLKLWYKTNYPKSQYVSSEEYLQKGVNALRNTLGYGEGGLNYSEIKELDKMHNADLLKYNEARQELNTLIEIGQVPDNIQKYIDGRIVLYGPSSLEERKKMETWKQKILQLDDYRQKWLNWKPRGASERGFITYTGISPNSSNGGRTTLQELGVQKQFFEGEFFNIVSNSDKILNSIISNNQKK